MKRKNGFHELIPLGWCEDPEKSQFQLRLYSTVNASIDQLSELCSGQKAFPSEDDVPIWLGLGQFEANGLLQIRTGQIHSDPATGQTVIPTEANNIDLPKSLYLLLATPRIIDGVDLGEASTIARLNRTEAMISLCFGANVAYRKVFDAVFEAKVEGQYSVVGEVMAAIQPSDGPHMSLDDWRNLAELSRAIDGLRDVEKRNRLRRALEFCQSAKASADTAHGEKFFFYWTAIQVLGEGRGTMATNKQFQTIYDFSQEEVEEALLWKGILSARNDFFHRGEKIHLHKDAERYMQLLVLDLLRLEAGLAPLRTAIAAKCGLDLGVFDRRK